MQERELAWLLDVVEDKVEIRKGAQSACQQPREEVLVHQHAQNRLHQASVWNRVLLFALSALEKSQEADCLIQRD